MKKLSILFLILMFVMVSAVVFAEGPYDLHKGDDGIIVWGETGTQFNNSELDRTGYTVDTDAAGKGQVAQLNVEALAYIPCYLKMEFNGNEGHSVMESFGPILTGTNLAQAIGTIPGNAGMYHMVFDNEIGGFVDGSWASLGHGRNAEVAPGANVYIQACDVFKVSVFSNDEFKYDIISAPLVGGSGSLNLEVGTSTAIDGTYNAEVFDSAKTINIGQGDPCETLTYFHRFRVPYSATTAQGSYSGTVTFKAYTI